MTTAADAPKPKRKGAFLISCADCGLDLGRISAEADVPGRSECPRCGWWCDWRFVWDGHIVPIMEVIAMRRELNDVVL